MVPRIVGGPVGAAQGRGGALRAPLRRAAGKGRGASRPPAALRAAGKGRGASRPLAALRAAGKGREEALRASFDHSSVFARCARSNAFRAKEPLEPPEHNPHYPKAKARAPQRRCAPQGRGGALRAPLRRCAPQGREGERRSAPPLTTQAFSRATRAQTLFAPRNPWNPQNTTPITAKKKHAKKIFFQKSLNLPPNPESGK